MAGWLHNPGHPLNMHGLTMPSLFSIIMRQCGFGRTRRISGLVAVLS